jgi:orotate phosphoribosyltransferase
MMERITLPTSFPYSEETYLGLLRRCGGYYKAVIDPGTNLPIGPMVAYSGTYDIEGGKRQYVGYVYYNCATLEQHPAVARVFAQGLASVVLSRQLPEFQCIVGVPDGGLIVAQNTAYALEKHYAGLQKKVVEVGTPTTKEKTKLVFARHGIDAGMRVVLCEDLINNFSTTDKAIQVVQAAGGEVVGLIALINRSWPARNDYNGLPAVVLLERPTPQFKQEDPDVVKHLEAVNFLPDVKPSWAVVEKAMTDAQARGIKIE